MAITEKFYTDSKVIKHLKYDSEERTLEVEFVTGKKFRYFDFGQGVFNDLINAQSVGSYFNKIKNFYRNEQIS